MKLLQTVVLLCVGLLCYGQSPTGIWKTIDDEDGTVKSHITITEKDGKLYGTVSKLIDPERETCTACKGDKKDAPIIGMEILWGLASEQNNQWAGGKIMDPKNGKTYSCKIEIQDENTLKVRGYLGFSLLGRTQTWYRVAD